MKRLLLLPATASVSAVSHAPAVAVAESTAGAHLYNMSNAIAGNGILSFSRAKYGSITPTCAIATRFAKTGGGRDIHRVRSFFIWRQLFVCQQPRLAIARHSVSA